MSEYFEYYASNEKVFRVRKNNKEGLFLNHLCNPNIKWLIGPYNTKQEALNEFDKKQSKEKELE